MDRKENINNEKNNNNMMLPLLEESHVGLPLGLSFANKK